MKRKQTGSRGPELLESVLSIATRIQLLNDEAHRQYAPIVDEIIRVRSRDVRLIEHTLDGLLDFCGYSPVLSLYKALCRHYHSFDPAATAFYVHACREMWLPDEEVKVSRGFRRVSARPASKRTSRRGARVALN